MFKQILVPLDGSSLAEQALDAAAAIARHAGARIDVVRVHQPASIRDFGNDPVDTKILDAEDAYLETIVDELSSGAAIRATHGLLRGEIARAITTRAQDVKADLIVLTSHGRTGLSRSWLGSVADGVIRNASIPVLMLRSQSRKADRTAAHGLFRRILVLLDGSSTSEAILPAATALGACSNAELVLLRVVQPLPLATASVGGPFGIPDIGVPSVLAVVQDPEATEESRATAMHEVRDVARALSQSGSAMIETHVTVAEDVATSIIDFAEAQKVDAIAMCTHGRGTSRLLVGSVSDKVLRSTHLPILIFRPGVL